MGSVVRVFKGGRCVGWQARIVRVGLRKLTLSFVSYDDACEWLEATEERYIRDPKGVLAEFNRLVELRKRRKQRTGRI